MNKLIFTFVLCGLFALSIDGAVVESNVQYQPVSSYIESYLKAGHISETEANLLNHYYASDAKQLLDEVIKLTDSKPNSSEFSKFEVLLFKIAVMERFTDRPEYLEQIYNNLECNAENLKVYMSLAMILKEGEYDLTQIGVKGLNFLTLQVKKADEGNTQSQEFINSGLDVTVRLMFKFFPSDKMTDEQLVFLKNVVKSSSVSSTVAASVVYKIIWKSGQTDYAVPIVLYFLEHKASNPAQILSSVAYLEEHVPKEQYRSILQTKLRYHYAMAQQIEKHVSTSDIDEALNAAMISIQSLEKVKKEADERLMQKRQELKESQ